MERYWIKKGIRVRHNDIATDLTVEKVVYKNVTLRDGTNKKYTVGVRCHWIDNGAYNYGIFHTNELKPANDTVSE